MLNGAKLLAAATLAILAACGRPEGPAPGGQSPPPRWFEDKTAEAGVAASHVNRTFENPYAEIMQGYTALGAAAAVADYDGDGFEDVFFTLSSADGKNRLYKNDGDFTFTEVGAEAGVAAGNDAENASANALWLDYDNDGDPDLLVVRFGQSLLYRNDGKKAGGKVTFSEITAEAGLGGRRLNSIAAIAFDYDLDGDLDLFLGNYFQPVDLFDPATPRFFPESFETAKNGGGVTAYRNRGDGTFEEVTRQIGLDLSGWTLDLGHADADQDGDDDLYVAADFGADSFFENNGGGADGRVTFTDVTASAIGTDTKKGMNADWGDFDNDGLFDVFVTNITDEYMNEGNFLWRNQGGLEFTDVARETGTYDTGWGWAGKFFDYDNDGWLDLYVVNGWVSASRDPRDNYVLDIFAVIQDPEVDLADARNWPPMGSKTLSGYQKNALYHNEGGIFRDEAARHGLDSELDARGVAVADFDQDGRLDLFVTNAGKPPNLWRNVAPADRHWVRFKLTGTESNRDAVGTRVWIRAGGRAQAGFVNGGNGFAAQSTRQVHFGLDQASSVDKVVVAWPSGLSQEFEDVPADKIYQLREGEELIFPCEVDGSALVASRDGLGESARTSGAGGPPADVLASFKAPGTAPVTAELPTGVVVAAESGGPAFATYREGMKALAAGDFKRAFDQLEAALAEEPDNLRYGADYRQGVIAAGEKDPKAYDRAIDFFEDLVERHPKAANAWLNLGFANVDKIPAEGAITQVLLANTALKYFGRALDIEDTWLGRYSRGNALLFWPPIFGRVKDGIRDLERAVEISRGDGRLTFHTRAWAALGDGYWRLDDVEKARQIWREGLRHYPHAAELEARLAKTDRADLDAFLNAHYDTGKRVDTHLREVFGIDSGGPGPAPESVERRGPETASAASGVRFEEIGEAAGVRFVHSTRAFGGRYKQQVLEMFTDGGAAVAVGDYDGDGWDDLFITDSGEGKTHHLMRNDAREKAAPTFTEVTAEAGVGGGNDARSIVADALWLDYDNDGDLDLYLGRFGTPMLFENGGPGSGFRFTDVSAKAGLTKFGNTIGTIAFDADGDGFLDLMLANYFQPVNLLALETTKVLPNNLDYADNGGGVTFYRNVALPGGRRGFVDETGKAGLAHHTGWSLDIGHADLDNDGDQDVYVASDYGTDRLFMNDGDGTFTDATEHALGFDTRKGMNVDMGDFDRDGFLDVYVTNITDEYMKECNMLWQNLGDGTFMDLAKETGTCDTDWGWAAKFGDFDNDGWEDLFVVDGLRSRDKDKNYIPLLLDQTITKEGVDFSDLGSYPDIGDMTWSGYQEQRLFHNLGDGTFKEIGREAGVANDLDGRGIGVGDFDNDGLLDFFQSNANQPSLLYRGTTADAGNWIELRLVGAKANRNAIGARVVVEAGGERYLREVNGGNGYSSQSTFRLHFGLGKAARVDSVEVRWPGPEARVEKVGTVPLNAITTLVEGGKR